MGGRNHTLRRILTRLKRGDLICAVPLLALVALAFFAILGLYFLVACEIPNYFTNIGDPSVRDGNVEFWPYTLSMEEASAIVNSRRSNKAVSVTPTNLNYVNIKFSDRSLPACKEDEAHDVLLLIKTGLTNFQLRKRLRATLLYTLPLLKARVKYAFLAGAADPGVSTQDLRSLEEEIDSYKDFIIGDFLDVYRNLTTKVMMGIRWAEEFCPRYKFLIFLDDDVVSLNLDGLLGFLKDPYSYPHQTTQGQQRSFSKVCETEEGDCQDLYAGYALYYNFPPHRDPTHKWYLPRTEYPPDNFPLYITGMLVILSKRTSSSFYHLSQFIPHIPNDDVYLGVLAKKLRIKPLDMSPFVKTGFNIFRGVFNYFSSSKSVILTTNHEFGCN